MNLNVRSEKNLVGVHPDLVTIIRRAAEITTIPFVVIEGVRTKERQAQLVKAGASQTMNSRHLTGHAVDLAALVGEEIRWDWPLYDKIAKAMEFAANQLTLPVEWGGNWKSFKDGPHFQLPVNRYP